MDSIFELAHHFGQNGPFGHWTAHLEARHAEETEARNEDIRDLDIIAPGDGWEGSAWQATYDTLLQRSKTYRKLLADYIKVPNKSLTLQHTRGRGRSEHATASTYIDFEQLGDPSLEATLDRLERYMRKGDKKVRIHLVSDYYDNAKNATMNELGRALTLIHEGVHIKLHYNQTDFFMISSVHNQHGYMSTYELQTIQRALKEYDRKLSKTDLLVLSMTGLTHKQSNGDALLIRFAGEVLKETVSAKDDKKLQEVMLRFLEMQKALIYESTD